MKKIIIVSPHFPPSNLAAVHRGRLFAQHLPAFGWDPIIVTVHHKHYEEALDWNLHKLLPKGLRVEEVEALPVKPVRLVGDIGVRGFYGMYNRILQIAEQEKIDFLYILIPSNYASLLGRMVHAKTGIPYGIDYIDPWVENNPVPKPLFSKHSLGRKLASYFEPIAVKKASLITGVAPGYYEDVLVRNPKLRTTSVTAAMPYGGEITDYNFVDESNIAPYLFEKKPGIIDLVYAGAMLPKAVEPLKQILKVISNNRSRFNNVRFHFIGTGYGIENPVYAIKPYAEEAGVYNTVFFEYPKRIPYLDVLIHLKASDGIFILGSTEAHYTPSKVYQGVLSQRPILAVLHRLSTASKLIEETNAGITLAFDGEEGVSTIGEQFLAKYVSYVEFAGSYKKENVNMAIFDEFSAKNVTKVLAQALDQI